MKTFSFFNEKGGVGKSLHTIMFASYLCYSCGAKVMVVDFENPIPRLKPIRDKEIELMNDPSSPLARYLSSHGTPDVFYEIVSVFRDRKYLFTKENSAWLLEHTKKMLSEFGYDYVLFDFPGTLVEYSPSYDFIKNGLLDFVAVPFDTEPVTRKTAFYTCEFLKDCGVTSAGFWNNVSNEEISRPNYLDLGEIIFSHYGLEVMEERIKSFTKARRDTSERNFIRSTVCWPDRYVELACPALKDLYSSLKSRLDVCPEHK